MICCVLDDDYDDNAVLLYNHHITTTLPISFPFDVEKLCKEAYTLHVKIVAWKSVLN